MIKKIIKKLFTAIISYLVLLGIGLAICYFRRESKPSLQDVLFLVGAVPIAFFSIGLIGDFKGRGDFFIQFSRSVSNQSSKERALQDVDDIKSNVASGLNWFMAGLFVWLTVYLM